MRAWMRQSIAKLLGVGSISTTTLQPLLALKVRSNRLDIMKDSAEFIARAGPHYLRKRAWIPGTSAKTHSC